MSMLRKVVIALLLAVAASTAVVNAASGWTTLSDLPGVQQGATFIALPDGRALLAGGEPNLRVYPPPKKPALSTALVYDQHGGGWKRVPDMPEGHSDGSAVLLPNGTVLVIGGYSDNVGTTTASVALFDPQQATWRDVSPMKHARAQFTATLLLDGRVLVTGGIARQAPPTNQLQPSSAPTIIPTATAELFDPTTETWAPAADMPAPRYGQVATLLTDGRVLLVGGSFASDQVATANEYDPMRNAWIRLPPLAQAIGLAGTAVLADGRPLVVGDYGHLPTASDIGGPLPQIGVIAEILDPVHGAWHAAQSPPIQGISTSSGFLLPGGEALFFGLDRNQVRGMIYDPSSDRWSLTLPLAVAVIYAPSAVRLSSGDLLIVAGNKTALYGLSAPAAGGQQSPPQANLLESSNTAFALTAIAVLLALLLGVQRLLARFADRRATSPSPSPNRPSALER